MPAPATTATGPADVATSPATGPAPGSGGGPARLVRETWILTPQSLARIRNELETLSDVTLQPVMFTLLFAYVFGSAINLGGPFGGTAAYHEYLIAGLFGLTVIGTLAGTAVGMTSDMETGLIDRFRSLPQRAAFLVFLPLGFVSNAFVPTAGMPSWLRAFANWYPVSAAASCRNLFGNPNLPRRSAPGPCSPPRAYTVLWSIGVVALFGPVAVHLYRRKSRN